ncbi:MAG TPA: putative sulfate exporter family transporter [Candidatus Dormibacteraeota bacterium]|nr:putative sulfate exporter family transporter [Candidatus Dormibacteraeota bacterium]
MNPKIIFFVLLILSASGFISPPIALCAGIIFGLSLPHPYSSDSKSLSKFLLQASIVALGFGMNLHEVLKAGRSGFLYTAIGITFAMVTGLLIGKLFTVRGTTSYLISTGTAICGGSAIAAVGPILNASEEEMAVSLGTVFILNAIALFIFPVIGKSVGLSQSQFGLWSALAIHDTSSVVGAASRYGTEALIIATTVKLARALWIVPLAFFTAAIKHGKSKVAIPWFILFFFLAAVINTFGPQDAALSQKFFTLGKLGLTATLFLIGTSLSRSTLKEVGWRPLAQGVVLWLLVGSLSLYFIHIGWISLSGTF